MGFAYNAFLIVCIKKINMYNFPITYKTKKTMKILRRFPILGSSQDSEKLGLTVKAVLIALIPCIIAVGRGFGLELIETDLVQLINLIAVLVSTIAGIVGLTRKYYAK